MQYDELIEKYQAAAKELPETIGEAIGKALQDKITLKAGDPAELTADFAPEHEFPLLKLSLSSTTDAAYDHILLMDKSLAGLISGWMTGGKPPEEIGADVLDAAKEGASQVLGQLQAALEGEASSFTAGEVQLEEVASQADLGVPEEGLVVTYQFTRGEEKEAYVVTHVVTGEAQPDSDKAAAEEAPAEETEAEEAPAEAAAEDAPTEDAASEKETTEAATEESPADEATSEEEPSEATEAAAAGETAEDDAAETATEVAEDVETEAGTGDDVAEAVADDLPLEGEDALGDAGDLSALFGDDDDDDSKGAVVEVSQAEFGDLTEAPSPANGRGRKIDMLLDVELDVTVELGRKDMPVEDILRLGKGSVIELNKLAGEPVDVLINGKKLAEGEVVVVEDHFGVRLTHLLETRERIKSLGR